MARSYEMMIKLQNVLRSMLLIQLMGWVLIHLHHGKIPTRALKATKEAVLFTAPF